MDQKHKKKKMKPKLVLLIIFLNAYETSVYSSIKYDLGKIGNEREQRPTTSCTIAHFARECRAEKVIGGAYVFPPGRGGGQSGRSCVPILSLILCRAVQDTSCQAPPKTLKPA